MELKSNKFYRFFRTTLIGGFVVVLPMSILIFIFKWLFGLASDLIHPITSYFLDNSQKYSLALDLLVLVTLILICFFIGLFVKTKIGLWIYSSLEKTLFSRIPGYKMVKETISQLLSTDKASPFASVALCQIFCNETLVTAFITDTHENGGFTVFVPTGPNPTSGNIYHLKPKYVHKINVTVEETMRSIISCGAGSQKLVSEYNRVKKELKEAKLKDESEQSKLPDTQEAPEEKSETPREEESK